MYKQIIIVRKDLNMNPDKLGAQMAHGSMAFMGEFVRNNVDGLVTGYFDTEILRNWLSTEYNKCVLQAKNKSQLLKAKTMAERLGMKKERDFWLIHDNCYTELKPEEDGRTLTCIGFKPMDVEIIDQIAKRYLLYN